jgi:predicted amidophosphoribosyltransferase
MFCPICWKEYPKGMRHCDSCRAELIEEKPKEMEGQGGKKPSEKPSSPAGDKTKK